MKFPVLIAKLLDSLERIFGTDLPEVTEIKWNFFQLPQWNIGLSVYNKSDA